MPIARRAASHYGRVTVRMRHLMGARQVGLARSSASKDAELPEPRQEELPRLPGPGCGSGPGTGRPLGNGGLVAGRVWYRREDSGTHST